MTRRKVSFKKDKTVSYGWVGRWRTLGGGALGWCLPTHLSYPPNNPAKTEWNKKSTLYLCKITVEIVKDKRGRTIRKNFQKE